MEILPQVYWAEILAAQTTIASAIHHLEFALNLVDRTLFEYAQRPVYGEIYESVKTQRDGGKDMKAPFRQVEQEVFEICQTGKSYRRSLWLETSYGRLGTRFQYINPQRDRTTYRLALEREQDCKAAMADVRSLKQLRQRLQTRHRHLVRESSELAAIKLQ